MAELESKLLIASPQLLDPNFAQAVILLVRHSDDGALGIILNRPASITVAQVWKQVHDAACITREPLFMGGPCPGPLMALHGELRLADFEVLPGLFFTAETSSITELVACDAINMHFYAGYAGWSPGQLEQEINAGAWWVWPAVNVPLTTGAPPDWDDMVRAYQRSQSSMVELLGIKQVPADPSMN